MTTGKDAPWQATHPNPEGYTMMQQAWLPATQIGVPIPNLMPWFHGADCPLTPARGFPMHGPGPSRERHGAEGPQSYADPLVHKLGQARRQGAWLSLTHYVALGESHSLCAWDAQVRPDVEGGKQRARVPPALTPSHLQGPSRDD